MQKTIRWQAVFETLVNVREGQEDWETLEQSPYFNDVTSTLGMQDDTFEILERGEDEDENY